MRPRDVLLGEIRDALPAGRDNAIPVPVLARRIGIGKRFLQELVGELVEDGVLVGSSCGVTNGLFLIEDLEDLDYGTAHIRARALGSLHRWSVVRKAALQRFAEPEVVRLFDPADLLKDRGSARGSGPSNTDQERDWSLPKLVDQSTTVNEHRTSA